VDIELSSLLLFILGLFYLIMLPGYMIFAGAELRNFDIIETITMSFGIGVGVLTTISIALSLSGSAGLSTSNLALANAVVLIVISAALFFKYKRGKRRNAAEARQNEIRADS
jgi:uncharacterized membrane protein